MNRPKTAYITGGASGIARSLAVLLLSQGWHVFIADCNVTLAQEFASAHNTNSSSPTLHFAYCNTTSWVSQLSSFQAGLKALGGRIDFVAPIAGVGERKWLPEFKHMGRLGNEGEFVEPDLGVVDVDLTGVLFTIALAVQQFSRQEPISWSVDSQELYRGKIGLVASVCGFYCVPSLPIYTAAKHALVGLTRSYGQLLRDEKVALSSVAPNVVRTNISPSAFYDRMEEHGLLTPMEGVMDAFVHLIRSDESGEVYECGPKGGWTKRHGAEYLDAESMQCCKMLLERAKPLHCG